MAVLTRARRFIHGIGHVQAPIPKHVENSDRGDRRAKRQGKDGNDLDMLMTAADPSCPVDGRDCRGHVVNTHWPHPMLRDGFRDPYNKIPNTRPVARMTLDEVFRLVAGRWPRRYRIRSIEHALRHCAKLGIVAVLEPKGDKRFEQDWVWQHIAATAERVGCTVSVRALPQNSAALVPARRAGFKAWEIS